MQQWLFTALILPCSVIFVWLFTVHIARDGGGVFPRLHNKRICLLIAHPDDEAMFFAPTLLALTARESGNHVKILCLSSGDADGLGETRKKELVKSSLMLGIRREEDVFIVEDKNFPDSMTAKWNAGKISDLLSRAFAPGMASASASTTPSATIDVLITFDGRGVSSHPNHISLYHGARTFLKDLMKQRPGWRCPVTMYALTSTGVGRKYLSLLDSAFTSLRLMAFTKKHRDPPAPLFFVNSPQNLRTAQNCMTKAHQSQMRWFRWGWIGLSRYMVVNDLEWVKA